MKKNIRCVACGRKRKISHENRCGTDKAYNPDCKKYEDFDSKVWLAEIEDVKKAKQDEVKAEKEKLQKEAKEKMEKENAKKEEGDKEADKTSVTVEEAKA